MWWLLSLVLLLGCGMGPSRFASRSAQASCALYASCGLLPAVGGDSATCEALVEDWETARVESALCAYAPDLAQQCIHDLRAAGCDSLSNDAIAQASPCDLVCGG